jgi:predicted kinase
MGSGKTSLAQAFARQTGWPLFSSDEIRKDLSGLKPTDRRWEPFGKGIYSEDMSKKTYFRIRQEAERCLKRGQSVVLDASYSKQSERLPLLHLAKKTGARLHFFECRAPLAVLRERLDRRSQEKEAVSDGRREILNQQRLAFDPVSGPVRDHLTMIQTSRSPDHLSKKLFKKMALLNLC